MESKRVLETIEVPIHATVTMSAVVDVVVLQIGRLELKPDSILVVAVPGYFTAGMQNVFHDALQIVLLEMDVNNKLLVLPGGVQIGVLDAVNQQEDKP